MRLRLFSTPLSSRIARLSVLSLSIAALTALPKVTYAQIAFTNIVNSTSAQAPGGGNFSSFVDYSLSGDTVAFAGSYNSNTNTGIFTGSGGGLTTIATNGLVNNSVPGGGTFSDVANPSISGSQIAFFGTSTDGAAQGIYKFSGGGLARIATTATGTNSVPGGGTFTGFGGPKISGNNVAFYGEYSGGTGNRGVFMLTGNDIVTIATDGLGNNSVPGGGTFYYAGSPSISGNTVAFEGFYGSNNGIFTSSGTNITTIVTNNPGNNLVPEGGSFFNVLNSSISGSNVAFRGAYNTDHGIFIASGGTIATVATTVSGNNTAPGGGTFSSFGTTSISGNNVAFDASIGATTHGMFFGSAGSLSKVIGENDTLFGSTVARVSMTSSSLDGSSLAFNYTLANGTRGIAIASFVPEPATVALLTLGLLGGIALRRREAHTTQC